ncbi:MAG: DEAD/DEAH box helicase [Flavobacteriales bacterium]|nr:DEAD/DEAH box helicase [Flavobacteriales bacterium]
MSSTINQNAILEKLNIKSLNKMQNQAFNSISTNLNTVLLSPTGTGKTLGFLLPVISSLNLDLQEVQALIIVPSRELALQIDQVIRSMGAGIKSNAVYGGRAFSKDKIELKHLPSILVGTPGRIADHLRKGTFSTDNLKTLILDEFDKSLEVGFENEMKEIIALLPDIEKKILTSATQKIEVPSFVDIQDPITIDFLEEGESQLEVKTVISPTKDKRETLLELLNNLGNQPGIIFCNFKDTIQDVSDFLTDNFVSHGCFYGGMEQKDRERALIKFRNGTHQILIATDLAARGIDVPEIKFIIHYELPHRSEEFTHRNGRTARMNSDGTAYVLKWKEERLRDFIVASEIEEVTPKTAILKSNWETIFISGGRKDKISKGDIAGIFMKQGNLTKDELGIIEIKQDCAFVAVAATKASQIVNQFDNTRMKKKKVRVNLV